MKTHLQCMLLLSILATAAGAPAAVPTPAEQSAPGKISLDVPPPPKPVPRTYHMHEGFYLRTSLGFGTFASSFADGREGNRNFDADGGSMAFDLLIGGSPSPGVSIGGALLLEPLISGDYTRDDLAAGEHTVFSGLIGPFIDGFPDPAKGWHLGGMIGLAAQRFNDINTNDDAADAGGIGGVAWFGYDFWVASEWALGPELRLMGMRTSDMRSGRDIAGWGRSFTLSISGVYN